MKVIIVGGGAAGFFSAIRVSECFPNARIQILEQSKQVLSKVRVSGGGRCNVTNATFDISELIKAYPRGSRFLKHAFHTFGVEDTMKWFANRGVDLKIESNRHVFPVSNDSRTIIDCLLNAGRKAGVVIKTQCAARSINCISDQFLIETNDGQIEADKVIIASGGSPTRRGLDWLAALGHRIADPVPSLFTFNMPGEPIRELMGLSVPNARIFISGTKFEQEGPLLITHWGMSGPAILKLSAFAARNLADKSYIFEIGVNWISEKNQDRVRNLLVEHIQENGSKLRKNTKPMPIPDRLWQFLLQKANLDVNRIWSETGSKGISRLVEVLTNDRYAVRGKTTFKDEFVTCGGVSLDDIDPKSMESRVVKGMYFAGEIMDIDAITGGFNFQAAWSTAYVAGTLGSS